jgi:hypothetical protein|tara:strand:+ start:1417 stop:1812 length:396 start_codon:yes stop_codon:yes gene_type:complete
MSFQNELKIVGVSFLCILTPFLILITVKLLTGKWEDLLLTGDWSIASAMIYSSSIVTVRNATNEYKGTIIDTGLDWFLAVTITMACFSTAIYVLALLQPSYFVGVVQICLFFVASIAHIKYGRAALRLRNQ